MNGTLKTIKFRDLKLKLPRKTKLRFIRQLQAGENEQVVAALVTLLGEEQMDQVWDLDVDISDGMQNLVGVVDELVVAVLGAYNINLGE